MRRRFGIVCLLAATTLASGCATRPAPRVTGLGDGVFRSPTAQEAEAYCRSFGAPMRFVDARAPGAAATEVRYRCD